MLKRAYLLPLLLLIIVSCSSSSDIDYRKQNDIKVSESDDYSSEFLKVDDIPKFKSREDVISPGYLMDLSHPSDDKLKGRFRVSFDGFLRLPYDVDIKANGLTLTELEGKVKEQYDKFFQTGVNKVKLSLIENKFYVEVRGFVKKPGLYLVTRNESIDKVIDKAGGLKGDLKNEFLTAVINQQKKSYTISLNNYFEDKKSRNAFTWTGADEIFINLLSDDAFDQSVAMVTVLGGVTRPGKVLYKENKDVFHYLNKSGGALASVSFRQAYLIRRTKVGLVKIHFNLTEMDEIPAIEANDVIMISNEQLTAWDKFLRTTSQVAGILASIAILIIAF